MRIIDVLNTWASTTNSIIICRPTFVDVNMTPERFAHHVAEHWSAGIARRKLSTLNLDSTIILSLYEPNRIRHRAVGCCVFGLFVTQGERTIILAIFTPSVAEMEYVLGCGMDVASGMLPLVWGDRNNTRKATSFLRKLKRCPD